MLGMVLGTPEQPQRNQPLEANMKGLGGPKVSPGQRIGRGEATRQLTYHVETLLRVGEACLVLRLDG